MREDRISLPTELEQRIKECSVKLEIDCDELCKLTKDAIDALAWIVSKGLELT